MNQDWQKKAVSPEDAVKLVKSGSRIFVHGMAATPTPLTNALAARNDLHDIRMYHLHTDGECAWADPEHAERIRAVSLFTGAPLRKAIEEGRADFVPVFLSDVPRLFLTKTLPLDVAILQLSPPDKHGYCTLGSSVDTALAASQSASLVLAEINERMPRTHGNTLVHLSKIHAFIHTDRPLHLHTLSHPNEIESAIGAHVADLVPDGATLQMGIGAIPDAALSRMTHKVDLGIHTEMFSDRVIDLVDAGVITNRRKKVHKGRIAVSFVVGSQRVFDFVDDNPYVAFFPCDHTNDTAVIRRNDHAVAINSALEVDLSGQVCADSMGYKIYSGIGGQMDFIRGAALSEGGMPIIALPSTAKSGTISRIVPGLKEGAGVVTTRGHVHWVVTEYGAVNLWGRSLRERAEMLISIAHPDFRAELKQFVRNVRHYTIA
ncbi:MAG: acetyl-CoA hydrolase/transferase family protein [Thermoanaerobaculia bacterium]